MLEHGTDMPGADERALLERRAAALARRATHALVAQEDEHVVVSLARESYAVELKYLLRIFPLRDLALLPGARPPLIGLTAWRGTLLRVIDLAAALGRTHAGIADQARVLVLGGMGSGELGILVDAVQNIVGIGATQIRPMRDKDDDQTPLLRGVTTDAVLVLDAPEMLRRFG